jgi:hypothetical protein
VRFALLRGREHVELGAVEAVAEGRLAIALSRGGAAKRYPHSDTNEDAAAFALGHEGSCVAWPTGSTAARTAEIGAAHLLAEPAAQWTEAPAGSTPAAGGGRCWLR